MSDKVKVDGGNSYKDPDFGDNTGYFTLPGSGKDQYWTQVDKKTGNVKLHKLTDDEVKAAKEAVKEEILMESKPLLHDEIESGGKLYMVHLFHKNDKIRISTYEEINGGKEEGFHMEKSMTYAEVFKLSNIDKENFASLFSYYNAILKSFKVSIIVFSIVLINFLIFFPLLFKSITK